MFFADAKKEALEIHEREVNRYNAQFADLQRECERLYAMRKLAVDKIKDIESLINSIANSPKEFEKEMKEIKGARVQFRQTEEYAAEAYQTAVKTGIGAAAGVGVGAAAASMAPTAAMWIATTFGTASTGTAISTLSGAVATKAALAWLGGGALTAGGGGIVAGKALLALAGPVGWGVGATAVITSVVIMSKKNKEIAEKAAEEARKIHIAGTQLRETKAIVYQIRKETELLLSNIKEQLLQASDLRDAEYTTLDGHKRLLLGALVNNTMSLARLLNKTVK